jgi:hypothetical protein
MQLSMEKQVDEKLFQLEKDIKEYEVLKLKELSKIEK